jgi:diguanylate cyclase
MLITVPSLLAADLPLDLRLVPVALMTTTYGPWWGALAALPGLLWLFMVQGNGVEVAPLLSTAGVLVTSALVGRVSRRLAGHDRRLWWTVPLLFSPVVLEPLLPGTAAVLERSAGSVRQALLLLVANGLGFVLALLVIQSRLRLLQATHVYREQAQTDALTGLGNRRQFDQALAELAPGDHLLVMDIDHFKTVNDRQGHAVGDLVLKRVAGALAGAAQTGDAVFRIGGEEFAVLMRFLSPDQAQQIAARCLNAVRSLDRGPAGEPRVTLSGGLSAHLAGESPLQTLARADTGLYAAKAAGRDRLVVQSEAPGAQGAQADPWTAVRETLALLSVNQEPQDEDWHTLLRAAIGSVPEAEAGTLYVEEDGDFVLRAQLGFDDLLLGRRHSPAAQQAWYARSEAAWTSGQARVLRGAEVVRATRASSAIDHDSAGQETYEQAGRIEELGASLGVPVVVDGHVVAFLNLDRLTDAGGMGARAQATATAFGAQAAALLAAHARHQRDAQRRRELEALARITVALRDAPDHAAIISAITHMTRTLLHAEQVVFLAHDEQRGQLASQDILGLPEGEGQVVLPRGQGLAWAAADAGDVLRVADITLDPRVYRPAYLQGGAMLAAPLIGQRGLLGVLTMIRQRPFGEDDAHLARSLVAHSATALERVAYIQELERAREGTLLALGLILEARDFETSGHTQRVVQLTAQLAEHLNLTGPQQLALREGAYLHDLGKLHIPDTVLLKPASLSPAEWTLMRQHTLVGEGLARHIPGVSSEALQVVRSHHERWDGTGYPDALRGADIPLLARVFAVCDVYDALTSERPYKPAWTSASALQEIEAQAGLHFDPEIVRTFISVMRPEAGWKNIPEQWSPVVP